MEQERGAFGVTEGFECPTCGFIGRSLITAMSPGYTRVEALKCGNEACREDWEVGGTFEGQQPFEDPDPEGVEPYPEELHAE